MINSLINATFSSVARTVLSVLLAIVILLVMVTVHEAGHYAAGKILKFGVDEFSIGFGPALFKRKNKRTGELFSVRAFPLGGYCAFSGEDGEKVEAPSAEEVPSGKPFNKTPPWQRIIVLAAGPVMNYLLALLCIFVLFFSHGQYEYQIISVAEGEYPAAYSLCEGDIITAVEGEDVYVVSDYISILKGKKEGDKAEFTIMRDGENLTVEVIMRADGDFKNLSDTSALLNMMGVSSMAGVPVRFGFFPTIGRSFVYSFKIGGTVLQAIGELLTGRLALSSMGGPITTITVTSKYAVQSFASFLEICAMIGVNLAVFNLLPIPALDGSKIIFTVIEWIRGKPLNQKVENVINTVGFILIIAFAVLVDILHFI